MKFTGAEALKKQAEELGKQLKSTSSSFSSFMTGLQNNLPPDMKADFEAFKQTPEGRKQADILKNIRAGVDEVINNIPKQ